MSNAPYSNILSNALNSKLRINPLQPIKTGGTTTPSTNHNLGLLGTIGNDIKNTIGGMANNIRSGGTAFTKAPVPDTSDTLSSTQKANGLTFPKATPFNQGASQTTPVKPAVQPAVQPVTPAVPSNNTGSISNVGNNSGTSNYNNTPATAQTPQSMPVQTTPSQAAFPTAVGALLNTQNTPNNQATGNAIGAMQGLAQNPNSAATQAQGQLQNISQNGSPAVNQANTDLSNFQKQSPLLLSDTLNNPNVAAEVSSGRGAMLGQTLSAENQALSTAQQNALAQQGQQITAGNEAGNLGISNENQQLTGQQNAGQLAQTAQGNTQGALGTAGQLAQTHFNGYVGIDPLTGKPLDSTGASQAAVTGSLIDANATSASGIQTNINNIQSKSDAASANFDYLNSLAQQGGVDSNSPILGTLRQKLGSTVEGNNAVAGFKAQLESVKQAYKDITGNEPNIPDDPTPSQLKTIQDALNKAVKNNLTNYQKKLNDLKGGSNNSTNDPLGIR